MYALGTGLPRTGYQAGPPGIVHVLLGSCHSCCNEFTYIPIERENRNTAINKFINSYAGRHTDFALSRIEMHAYALQQNSLKQICSVLVLKRQELELTAKKSKRNCSASIAWLISLPGQWGIVVRMSDPSRNQKSLCAPKYYMSHAPEKQRYFRVACFLKVAIILAHSLRHGEPTR
jgi:hypothetical protein